MDGYVEWDAHKTWYRIAGDLDSGKPPVVMLHGGPGAAHDYLEEYEELTKTGRAVVFYDQLGCGRSDHLPDAPKDFWTVDLFKTELIALLDGLELSESYHLLGQSWGGMLAMEHALDQPSGLRSIVVANSPASIPLWLEEANRLRAELPADVQQTLLEHEVAETTDHPDYEAAMMVFYGRHLCRVPWPESLQRSFAQMGEDPTVYHTMNGPSEFHVIGVIKDWDITHRLGEIDVPTLLISGEYDEATPKVVSAIHERIPNSEWLLVEDASHSTHVEKPQEVLSAVETFFDRVERETVPV